MLIKFLRFLRAIFHTRSCTTSVDPIHNYDSFASYRFFTAVIAQIQSSRPLPTCISAGGYQSFQDVCRLHFQEQGNIFILKSFY